MLHPAVFNTAQVCYEFGVRHAVLSPGSRNAPLLISFARHKRTKKYIIPDERTAGFIALGIAQETTRPVVLSCTSGSALLNYAPAVAEAYYREIPLVILSADRPPELIDQRDGQTIRQYEALKNHVKASYQLPLIESANDTDQYQSLLMEGVTFSKKLAKGPVHLNIPFKEPFYPSPNQDNLIYTPTRLYKSKELFHSKNSPSIPLSKDQRILILPGQSDFNKHEKKLLKQVSEKVPVIRSPLNNLDFGINHVDGFVTGKTSLQPDILITTGLSVLSKNLKIFLRTFKPKAHYHFDPAGVAVDTFKSSPKLVKQSLFDWLPRILEHRQTKGEYLANWKKQEEKTRNLINSVVKKLQFSETSASFFVYKHLPPHTCLHLSNSMPVRYADLFGVPQEIKTYGNRGTSGIDGCTSTALGVALVSQKLNILVTGDLAFLYDRNAFFHNHKIPNLRIVVMNNQGGGIFRLIKGPSSLPELNTYFETTHNRTAEYICQENGLSYSTVSDLETLKNIWYEFLKPSINTKVLEVFTDPEINQKAYEELRNKIHEYVSN